MGSWFSNLHVRKNDSVTAGSLSEYIRELMAGQQYVPAEEAEADGAFAITAAEDSGWLSVYSDLFSFDDPKEFTKLAEPMSAQLGAEVLGVSCFDSDYLYLNLIDVPGKTDAWASVGSSAGLGIRRRTNLSAWKGKVHAFPRFREGLKKSYVFAEEVLAEVGPCLHLPPQYSMASYEYLKDVLPEGAVTWLYFKLPEGQSVQEPPALRQHTASLMPCNPGKPATVSVINTGGASRGLSVYFLGPYVEDEEITFTDVCFVQWKNGSMEAVPIVLTKGQLTDGQWAYHYHDPGFRIPGKVDGRLPMAKRMRAEHEQSIIVRFVPQGNPRKMLDITVVLEPDKNPAGQSGWNVWRGFGSKEAYIAQFNKTWELPRRMSPAAVPPELRREDFD